MTASKQIVDCDLQNWHLTLMTPTYDLVFGGPWKVLSEDGTVLGSSLTYLENPQNVDNILLFLLGQKIQTIASSEASWMRDCHIIFEGGARLHYFDVGSYWPRWTIRPINRNNEIPVGSIWQQEWRPVDMPIPITPVRTVKWLYDTQYFNRNIRVNKNLEPMLSPLIIGGEGWSSIALCPWRLSDGEGNLMTAYGRYSEPEEFNPLAGTYLLGVESAGNTSTSDLRLTFNGGLSLELFPLSPTLTYTFQNALEIPDSVPIVQRSRRNQLPVGWAHSAPRPR